MAKIVKIGWYDIPLKSVLSFKLGDKSYNRSDYEKNYYRGDKISEYYRILKKNTKKLTYILSKSHSSRDRTFNRNWFISGGSWFNTSDVGGVVEIYLVDGKIQKFDGPAVIIEGMDRFYIDGCEVTLNNWLEHPKVKIEMKKKTRRKKLNRIFDEAEM